MKLYDAEENAQTLIESTAVTPKKDASDFSDFNV